MVFHQIQFLPIAYLTILMWVVCANVVAKLFGPMLVNATTGWLHQLLAKPVGIEVTADRLVHDLFEEKLLTVVKKQILLSLFKRLTRIPAESYRFSISTEVLAVQKVLLPGQYWSGCPPNHC